MEAENGRGPVNWAAVRVVQVAVAHALTCQETRPLSIPGTVPAGHFSAFAGLQAAAEALRHITRRAAPARSRGTRRGILYGRREVHLPVIAVIASHAFPRVPLSPGASSLDRSALSTRTTRPRKLRDCFSSNAGRGVHHTQLVDAAGLGR